MAESTKDPTPRTRSELHVVHRDAAGIDIGARQHYVAVPADRAEAPVRTFGCTTPQLQAMAQWLLQCGVRTVAIESTGVYWVASAAVLEETGIEVWLVDARQARTIPGRKTDVQDCQWLQQLHTFGLLRRAFRPAQQIQPLRTLWRHRAGLVEHSAQQIHLMHKALEQMNVQLHKVLSDVTGVSGMRILRAILAGQRDPAQLVLLCHATCKRPQHEFIDALTGHYRDDLLFTLRQAVETHDFHQKQIADCDTLIEQHLARLPHHADPAQLRTRPDAKRRSAKRRKNETHFDLRAQLYALTGVDLTQIEGIDARTAFTLISEQGLDMSAFPTEKHFASHLGLCPNHRITGGRIKRRATRKNPCRAATALRIAAQTLRRSPSALGAFYRRMHARLGAPKAITATAHKLAKLIYRLLKHGQDYVRQGQEDYERRFREQQLKRLRKQAKRLGCELIQSDTGEVLS